MPPDIPTIKLNNGISIPALGLGTYKLKHMTEEIVGAAIDAGYRLIDTSPVYNDNEVAVGRAVRDRIRKKVIKREDLIVVSKLWNSHHSEGEVLKACEKSLRYLSIDYIDLYLINWPFGVKTKTKDNFKHQEFNEFDTTTLEDVWRQMETCVSRGLVRSIGVSNFNSNQLQRILDIANIKPVVNQSYMFTAKQQASSQQGNHPRVTCSPKNNNNKNPNTAKQQASSQQGNHPRVTCPLPNNKPVVNKSYMFTAKQASSQQGNHPRVTCPLPNNKPVVNQYYMSTAKQQASSQQGNHPRVTCSLPNNKPVVNQIECSVRLPQTQLIQFCKERDVAVMGYRPLGAPGRAIELTPEERRQVILENHRLTSIGERYNKTVAQVCLRYTVQLGVIPIVKTAEEERLQENMNVFNFNLDIQDIEYIQTLHNDFRTMTYNSGSC
ncbi:hypothetical protein J6590_004996 [Homalodisca vitripennis]|nr:hypothetical protein J6590_004996 [Homalodisca vitripennis]